MTASVTGVGVTVFGCAAHDVGVFEAAARRSGIAATVLAAVVSASCGGGLPACCRACNAFTVR